MTHISLLWLYILIVIGIVFLLVIGYKAMYKSSVNRALTGKKPLSLIEPIPFIQSLIVIASLVFLVIISSNIKTLQTELENIKNQNGQLLQQLGVANSRLSILAADFSTFQQEQSLVRMADYQLRDYDEDSKTAELQFLISLNRLPANSTVQVIAIDQSDYSMVVSPIITPVILNLDLTLELDATKTYKLYLNVNTNGNLEQAFFMTIQLDDMFRMQFSYSVDYSFNHQERTGEFIVTVVNNTFGLTKFEISSIIVAAYQGDVLLLSEPLVHEHPNSIKNMYYRFESMTMNTNVLTLRF